jgi:protein-arginine kinase activator protein McsA
MDSINIHLHPREQERDKTRILVCNWCNELHDVTPEYKEEVLARGAEIIAEALKADPKLDPIKPEETWTCGKCYLYLMNLPTNIKTDCHDHPVPEKKRA